MQRILGLLRDTWWVWLAFLTISIVGAIEIDIAFLAAVPISLITIAYFAAIRYDEHGKPKR